MPIMADGLDLRIYNNKYVDIERAEEKENE